MANDPQVKLDVGGDRRAMTPASLKEHGRAQNALSRTRFGGSILILLCVLLGIAMACNKTELGTALIAAVSAGLGFMLGERTKPSD